MLRSRVSVTAGRTLSRLADSPPSPRGRGGKAHHKPAVRLAAGVAVWLAGVATGQDMLQLEPPPAPAWPDAYVVQRIEQLSRELPVDEATWRDRCRRDVVQTATQLFEAARAGQAPDTAVVLAETLTESLPQVWAMVDAVPDDTAWPAHAIEAPANFGDDAAVMQFVRARLGRLIAVRQAVAPAPVWASAWPGTPAPPTEADLAALAARVGQLPVPPHVRDPLGRVVDAVAAGLAFPEFLPYVDESYRLLDATAALIELVQATVWLEEDVRSRVYDEVAAAAVEYADPVTRGRAAQRLRDLQSVPWIIQDAEAARAVSAAAGRTAEQMARHAVAVQAATVTPAPQREAALAWHRRARAALQLTTQAGVPQQPTLRTAYIVAERDRASATDRVLRVAAGLPASPLSVNLPEAAQSVQALRTLGEGLAALAQVKEAMDAADAYRPQPPTGVRQRVMRLADQVRGDATRAEALRELGAFVRQQQRYAVLAGEEPLGRGVAVSALLDASRAQGITQAIAASRTAWATAWATGQPADACAKEIEPLRTMMLLAMRVTPTQMSPGWTLVPPGLNRWAGWQAPEAGLRAVVTPLEQDLARVVEEAARGEWPRVAEGMGQLQRDHTLALAVLRLAEGEATGPEGVEGVLAQVLLSPGAGAYLADHRADVALLSRCVMEWPLAAEHQRIDLRDRATQAIRRLRRDLPALE